MRSWRAKICIGPDNHGGGFGSRGGERKGKVVVVIGLEHKQPNSQGLRSRLHFLRLSLRVWPAEIGQEGNDLGMGTSSRTSSRRFPSEATTSCTTPVTLPPDG